MDLHFEGAGGVAGQLSEHYTGGYAVLTSHQLIWVDSSASTLPGRSCSFPLSAVQEAVLHSPLLWAAPRLCIRIHTDAAGNPMHDGTYHEQVTVDASYTVEVAAHVTRAGKLPLRTLVCAGKRDL